MILNKETEELIKVMAEWQQRSQRASYGRVDPSVKPVILFIGQGCARAAGLPSHKEVARELFDGLFALDPDVATHYLSEEDQADEDRLVEAFYTFLRDMSPIQRASLLQSFYEDVPIPLSYQDLARLIKAGYFSHVLTTNTDTLLEQALSGAGQGSDPYRLAHNQVITFGLEAEGDIHFSPAPDDTSNIIKLPGNLARSDVFTAPEQIEDTLRQSRSFERAQGRHELVMVGYEFESESVNNWLATTIGEELWWVNPEPPDTQRINPIKKAWKVRYISGSSAAPDVFFGELALRLLRLPLKRSMTRPLESYPSSGLPISVGGLYDEHSEQEYLLDKIRRCRAELQSLIQTVTLGQKDPQIVSQITFQQHRLIELEDRLRNLSSSKSEIPHLSDQITTAVEQAGIDSSTLSYLRTQANAIKKECNKRKPNQHIVSASIGATVSIAERMGAEVADSQAVSTLASFAPSSLLGRIL